MNLKVKNQKNISAIQQFFKGIEMFVKSLTTELSDAITGVGFLSNKFLFHKHIFRFFQCGDVTRNIAITGVEHFFERQKIDGIIDHKNGHNPKSNATFKGFIQFVNEIFHFFKSYLKYIDAP